MSTIGPGDEIVRGYSSARSIRMQRDSEYLSLARYIRPEHEPMWQTESSTNTRPAIELLWDDTAIGACDQLARGVNSMTHNPATEWFDAKDKTARVNDNGEASAWYGMVTDDMRKEMLKSSVYPSLLTRLRDVFTYGFGAVYSYQDDNKGHLAFENVPAPECFFTLARDGSCRTFWRPRRWNWQEIEAHGIKVEDCDALVKNSKENNNYEAKFEFIHAVYHKDDAPAGLKASNHDYIGVYVEKGSKKVLEQHGFHEMPYDVLTWDAVPSSPYAIGIGYKTLPEIRNVNAQRKKFDRLLDIESDPPILAPNQDESNPRAFFQGGERIYGGMTGDGKRLYEALFNGSGTRSVAAEVQSSKEAILQSFHNQLMLMLNSHQMTAQEVASRDEKIIQAMGPFIIPMYQSLKNICDRFFHARMRAGAYDPLPRIFDASTEVEYEFTGILAKAMKKLVSGNIVMFYQEAMATIGQVDPTIVRDGMDHGLALRSMADARAVPAGMVFTKDQLEEKQKQNAAQDQNRMLMENAPGLAKAAKDGAEAVNVMGDDSGQSRVALAP